MGRQPFGAYAEPEAHACEKEEAENVAGQSRCREQSEDAEKNHECRDDADPGVQRAFRGAKRRLGWQRLARQPLDLLRSLVADDRGEMLGCRDREIRQAKLAAAQQRMQRAILRGDEPASRAPRRKRDTARSKRHGGVGDGRDGRAAVEERESEVIGEGPVVVRRVDIARGHQGSGGAASFAPRPLRRRAQCCVPDDMQVADKGDLEGEGASCRSRGGAT